MVIYCSSVNYDDDLPNSYKDITCDLDGSLGNLNPQLE